jgi:HSP20 family protein
MLPSMSRFFDDFLTRDLFDWTTDNFATENSNLPSVNIIENEDNFVVQVAAPGMSKDDFHIEVKDNALTIRSEKKVENEEKNENFLRREFSYASFQRSFNLNKELVDQDSIKANYKDGILNLTLAKKEEAKEKPARVIKIS